MTEPCKRHKGGPVVRFRVVADDNRTHWAVVEFRDCARCGGAMHGRIARGTIKRDRVDALVAYGCTVDEVAAYVRTHWPEPAAQDPIAGRPATEPKESPLTGWPFPVSAHMETT